MTHLIRTRVTRLLPVFSVLLLCTACDRMQRREPIASDAVLDQIEGQLGEVDAPIDTSMTAQMSGAFRAAAAKALPAVVQITTTQSTTRGAGGFPFGGVQDDAVTELAQAFGSGFVMDAQGRVLTNYHVVADAVDVRVKLADGRDYAARVIGGDPDTDVAVIQLDGISDSVPVAELGQSEELRVGDWVLALGNPMSLNFTVTAGIVSAKSRSINILRERTSTAIESFIQTDAAINPGNSGGPLVDLRGRVVGINTAIESPTGFFAGAGFAIPIDLARKVATDLIEYGEVHRPRLGVGIADVSAADAQVYKLPAVTGVEITSVTPNEPAARAGIQLGDVVITVNGARVNGASDFQSRVATLQPDTDVRLGFIRYGKPLETSVRLGTFAVARVDNDRPRALPLSNGNALGFDARTLPPAIAERLGVPATSPVVVEIDPFGPASKVGLAPGDVIRRMNGRDIHSLSDLRRASSGLKTGDVVSLIVVNARAQEPVSEIVNYRIH